MIDPNNAAQAVLLSMLIVSLILLAVTYLWGRRERSEAAISRELQRITSKKLAEAESTIRAKDLLIKERDETITLVQKALVGARGDRDDYYSRLNTVQDQAAQYLDFWGYAEAENYELVALNHAALVKCEELVKERDAANDEIIGRGLRIESLQEKFEQMTARANEFRDLADVRGRSVESAKANAEAYLVSANKSFANEKLLTEKCNALQAKLDKLTKKPSESWTVAVTVPDKPKKPAKKRKAKR